MNAEVMAAVALLQGGDRQAARDRMLALWESPGIVSDPTARCTLAHFLADTEEDVRAELTWDQRALQAATGGQPGENLDPVVPELASFLPSLHLNVGDAYRRSGDLARAAIHASHGLQRSSALPEDGYGATVRQALLRLQMRANEAGLRDLS